MIRIQDNRHSERDGDFPTFEAAIGELRRRATIPWDQAPNRAPCKNWHKCGRDYEVVEFDTPDEPCTTPRRVPVLKIRADGVQWSPGFGPETASPAGA